VSDNQEFEKVYKNGTYKRKPKGFLGRVKEEISSKSALTKEKNTLFINNGVRSLAKEELKMKP